MYHVKNDKRCIRSAESIMKALEKLMAKLLSTFQNQFGAVLR